MNLFQQAGLRPEILKAVEALGFETPTPIQQRCLELLREESGDLVALAQTGTGKTGAFGLPLLHRLDSSSNELQALILCPTRELCLQISGDLNDFARFMPGTQITPVYGGASIETQIRALRKGAHIVVGTPGRVLDMIRRGELDLSKLDFFVLDEADEMLNMGFKEDLESIFKACSKQRNTWLFSATMPVKVEQIARKYMHDATRISIGKRNEGASNIEHHYYMVQARDRFEALSRIVAAYEGMYGVVFCRTRLETNQIADKLRRRGYQAQAINGDLSQPQRDQVMKAFRKGEVKLLVATDVAARGLDVDELSHVVNYNLPDDPEVYVHRSGRTGRAGKSGICVSIIHSREQRRISELEKMLGKKFLRKQVPLLSEICKYHVLAMTDELLNASGKVEQMHGIPAEVYLKMESLSKDEIIEQWMRWAFAKQQNQEPGLPNDINITASSKSGKGREARSYEGRGKAVGYGEKGGRHRNERDAPGAFTEVEINIGRKHYLKPNKIMGVINELTRNPSIQFGRIDIFEEKSFIGIESAYADEVAAALDGLQFGSVQLHSRVKQGAPRERSRSGDGRKGKKNFRSDGPSSFFGSDGPKWKSKKQKQKGSFAKGSKTKGRKKKR